MGCCSYVTSGLHTHCHTMKLHVKLSRVHFVRFRVRRSRGEMYTGHRRLCVSVCLSACLSVSLSLTAFPHYCTDPDVAWGMAGVPLSCALLGRFAIGARVSLL